MIARKIFLNAGHSLKDPGAVKGGIKESVINIQVRDYLVPLLKKYGFKVEIVPDELNLIQSVNWVNQRAKSLNNGLALSLHCNAGGGIGAECFYYAGSEESKKLAEKLLSGYCEELKMKNRGAKPDTATRFGRLGWIRDTKPWALLLEMGFIDNSNDLKILQNYQRVAFAILKGVARIYGIEIKEEKSFEKEQIEDLRNAVKLWQEKYQVEKKKREQVEKELKKWKEEHSRLVADKRTFQARCEDLTKERDRLNSLLKEEKEEKLGILEQAKKLKTEILLLQEKYKKDSNALMKKIQQLTLENTKLKSRKPCTLANCFAFMVEYLLKVVKIKKD